MSGNPSHGKAVNGAAAPADPVAARTAQEAAHKSLNAKRSWAVRSYLWPIMKGMGVSFRHLFKKPVTFNYPEVKPRVSERFRGEHRLTKDENGNMKCVACYMCATACPAMCITIEAQAAPPEWEGRDKIPKVFEIDMLKCIYCGFCVEACPKEAIEMTNKVPQVYDNRQAFIYGIDKLLNN
jgi:NADH-quinone oxidoreductase subunit I